MFSAEITTCVINNFAAGTTHCEVIKVRVSAHSFEFGTGHMLLVLGEQRNCLLVVLVRRTHSPI